MYMDEIVQFKITGRAAMGGSSTCCKPSRLDRVCTRNLLSHPKHNYSNVVISKNWEAADRYSKHRFQCFLQ